MPGFDPMETGVEAKITSILVNSTDLGITSSRFWVISGPGCAIRIMLTSVVRQPVGQRHCLLECRQCFGLYRLNCSMKRTRAGRVKAVDRADLITVVLVLVVEAIRAGGHDNQRRKRLSMYMLKRMKTA